jgi:GT2 family glycosyltransferase/glycosyltransferase involved in cell wall biosynthesis
MHRSGTSQTAHLLTKLGIYCGAPPLSTSVNEENRNDSFERSELREICDTVLRASGCDWWSVNDFSIDRVPAPVRADVSDRFAALLTEMEQHRPWFIKEPRLCFVWPLLRSQVARPIFVHVWRDPIEVARSLKTSNGFPIDFGISLWEAYVRSAHAVSRRQPSIMVSYNELLKNPVRATNRLVKELRALGVTGIEIPDKAQLRNAIDAELDREPDLSPELGELLTPSQRRLVTALASRRTNAPVLFEPLSAVARLRAEEQIQRGLAERDNLQRIAALKKKVQHGEAHLEAAKSHVAGLRTSLQRKLALTFDELRGNARRNADRAVVLLRQERTSNLKTLFVGIRATLGANQGSAPRWPALYLHYLLIQRRKDAADLTLLARSGLFDAAYYLENNLDVAESGIDPLIHYVDIGATGGRNPSALFHSAYYLEENPDVADHGMNPLIHFIRHGRNEGRLPCAKPSVKTLIGDLSLPTAPTAGSSARPEERADAELLNNSPLFDKEWYLTEYKDVARKRLDPVLHYLRKGATELRNPGPGFSTGWYFENYPDVRRAGVNPLVHYLRYGRERGQLPAPQLGVAAWWSRLVPIYRGVTAAEVNSTVDVAAALGRMQHNPEPVAVIVPIYNAPEELEDCLKSLIQHSGRGCRIILIDDASPNPRIGEILASHAATPFIEIYRNEVNLGFTRTVNKGIKLAGHSDVIFLNSDTKVTPGWIRNLRVAAYSGDKVATATPLSNNAGAFSAPEIGQSNDIPAQLSLDEYGRAISQASRRLYPSAPTGNGFCMYVRRDCINEIGLLDAEAFPRGYGEENDFCMRAGRSGWTHIVDDATLIYHVRSASFGDAKDDLITRGRAVVDERYPEYTEAVRDFVADPALRAARERVRDVANAVTDETKGVRPRVLFVLSTRTGGTPQTNQDLMSALSERVEPFVLHCNASTVTLMHFADGVYIDMEKHVLTEPLKAFQHRNAEYDAVVANWLVRYAIELVHVRHIAWHGLGLVDAAKALGLPVVFSFHDFYTICPTIKLLDEANRYCGGKCTATIGECRNELWREPDFPPLKHAAISAWREQLRPVLEKCDAFVTTAQSAKATLSANYPFLEERDFQIIPHGRDFERLDQIVNPIQKGDVVRILIPGNISVAKGLQVIADLGNSSASQNIELHVLGRVSSKVRLPANVIIHGAYARGEFAEKAKAIAPHIGGVFSIWPETYCHTLTELWASGIPVIGFDYGAVGERVRESGAGWLAAEPTAAGVIEIIERLRARPEEHVEKLAAVLNWQNGIAIRDNCSNMGDGYFDLYRTLIENRVARSSQGASLPAQDSSAGVTVVPQLGK